MAQGAAPPAHLLLGTDGPGAQSIGVPAWPPLAVEPSGLRAPGGALGVAGIAQAPLDAPRLQQCAHGHPGDPSRCHGDGGHATVQEPVGEAVEVRSARTETAHGLGVTPRRDGDPGLGCADVDTSRGGVTDLEGVGAHG